MHFDPYLSPPLLASPVSSPPTPPISAPAVDQESVAGQRAKANNINDVLRAQNAQLTRDLAAANKTIAKLKSLASSSAASAARPVLAPLSRPRGPVAPPRRAPPKRPSTTMEPEKKPAPTRSEKPTAPTNEEPGAPPAKASPKRKSDSEDDEEKMPRKKVKSPKTSPFAGFASSGPSASAAPTSSPFGASKTSSFGSGSSSSFSSFGTGSSFAPAGLNGAVYTYEGHVLQWSKSLTAFFERHDKNAAFPSPPTAACTAKHCSTSNADRALAACPHAIMKALRVLMAQECPQGGNHGRKAWFKKMRSWWHPDRVANLAGKDKKEKCELMAKEVFCELGSLMEEVEEQDKKENDKTEQGKKGNEWWKARK